MRKVRFTFANGSFGYLTNVIEDRYRKNLSAWQFLTVDGEVLTVPEHNLTSFGAFAQEHEQDSYDALDEELRSRTPEANPAWNVGADEEATLDSFTW